MTVAVHPQAPLLGEFRGRSRQACANRVWLAEQTETDVDTVVRWTKGKEPVPDEVISWLAEWSGFSIAHAMNWQDAPRSVIPEQWRGPIAEDAAERLAKILPSDCERLLRSIEWRLRVDPDLEVESPDIPRLQRLRMALLEFMAEPVA